jgi:hypothetical protein
MPKKQAPPECPIKKPLSREEQEMVRRSVFILAFVSLVLLGDSVKAQGYYEFLGSPRAVADKFSPRFGIRYNTQGFDEPEINWKKREKRLAKKGVPEFAVAEMKLFPGGPDAIGDWIDEAFADVQTQFSKCASLSNRAGLVSPRSLYVTIMSSAFFEPYWKIDVAGAYYPSTHQIKVLNIYYIWSGPNVGWLRHARDLIKWEIGNYFATELKVQAEPRPSGWPCNASAK